MGVTITQDSKRAQKVGGVGSAFGGITMTKRCWAAANVLESRCSEVNLIKLSFCEIKLSSDNDSFTRDPKWTRVPRMPPKVRVRMVFKRQTVQNSDDLKGLVIFCNR